MTVEPTERPISFLLTDLARLARRHFAKGLADARLGLTLGEARTLAFVQRLSDTRQSVLAEYLGVEPMTLVGFLDRLEAAGLVERCPDPNDRRAKLIRLTDKAALAIHCFDPLIESIRKQAFAGFSDADIERTFALLQALQTNLATNTPEPAADGNKKTR
ncbi:MarR family winged helix-turn-helix transcriptional regulator [Breoghania sp.]|uniref:MarR family winged helix-turn-helix transcriptional regulator n=1 Tax=Breoghania sp. TaxID=2065378 RepID=UPI002638D83D|nr:MarR family winged helix-turn-helix transcriptional regulator [Breoghania sp.]MDJ0930626.1 MarR family winged helix-turn-helix transcriptional regulator [Breoghania sp.]